MLAAALSHRFAINAYTQSAHPKFIDHNDSSSDWSEIAGAVFIRSSGNGRKIRSVFLPAPIARSGRERRGQDDSRA